MLNNAVRRKLSMKTSAKLSIPFVMVAGLVSGCSGHPGAGHWQSKIELDNSDNPYQYSALKVEFDGKGTLQPNQLHVQQEGKDDLWCVWQAKSATALEVNCGDGSVEKTNLKFELEVTGEKQQGAFAYSQANLSHAGQLVAQLERKL